ncbi:MAG: DEAD/DEAH box helicase [Stellaceae bacterium]
MTLASIRATEQRLHAAGLIPRPYQSEAAQLGAAALRRRGNSLQILPTGSGKTIVALLAAREAGFGRALVVVHRAELVDQWLDACMKVLPGVPVSLVTAEGKDWSGRIVVAMAQTLAKAATLETMPAIDLVILDEAHHATAPTWQAILDAARERCPRLRIYGCTATPERGDGQGLHRVFDNVSFDLPLRELVDGGFVVPPRAFMFDLAPPDVVDAAVRNAADFGEQEGVAAVLNTPERNAEAVRLWAEKAGDRATIAFTSTVEHAAAMAEAWRESGISAELMSGETPRGERAAILDRLRRGETQVVTNAIVLTEGFDEPRVGCVALLRGCSHKSLLIQMAGRGLRPLDAARYPGLVKPDAIVIDFGRSLARHGDLIAGRSLADRIAGDAAQKECQNCSGEVPAAVRECPLCGHEFPAKAIDHADELDIAAATREARLLEVDVLASSQFAWTPIDDDGLIAVGFDGSAALRHMGRGVWVAVGLPKEGWAVPLRVGPRYLALSAADDFLRMTESGEGAHKTREWLERAPTARQLELMARYRIASRGLTRYGAACQLSWEWQRKRITAAALEAMRRRA